MLTFIYFPRCVLCAYLNYLTSVDLVPYHIPNSLNKWGIPAFTDTPLIQDEWIPTSLAAVCWDTLRTLCTNRNKILPRSDTLLESWGHVISEAQFLDEKLCEAAGISDGRQNWHVLGHDYPHAGRDPPLKLLAECELLSAQEPDYFYWYGEYLYSMTIMSWRPFLLSYELESMHVQDLHRELFLQAKDRLVKHGPKWKRRRSRTSYCRVHRDYQNP